MRGLHSLGVIAALVACSCTCNCYPQPETPGTGQANTAPPGVDQAAYGKADAAGQACFVLKWLGCEEGSPEGLECDESLRKLTEIGTFKKSNLICIRTSRTVERVRGCDVECSNK